MGASMSKKNRRETKSALKKTMVEIGADPARPHLGSKWLGGNLGLLRPIAVGEQAGHAGIVWELETV